jgi:hypothetical protein
MERSFSVCARGYFIGGQLARGARSGHRKRVARRACAAPLPAARDRFASADAMNGAARLPRG